MTSARPAADVGAMPICQTHTLVIGAGPSGLAAACRLAQAGLKPVIVEKSPYFGGLMRSIRHGDFVVDLGRKELYARIPEVDALWTDLLGEDYRAYPHRVGSLYRGRILEMSSRFRGIQRGMSLASFLAGGIDLAWAWMISGFRKPANYEDYWYQRAGRRFARALAQGYWEKFRGQPWADLPVPDVHADGQEARSYSFGAITHGVKLAAQGGASGQRTWRHPARGTGQVCGMLAQRLRALGVEIEFNCEIFGMVSQQGAISDIFAKTPTGCVRYEARNIVSSLQVEALVSLIGHQATTDAPPVRQRTVVLAYLFLDEQPRFPHAWLEVNEPSLQCGRITNYAAFNGDMVPPGRTALCVEFFLDGDDPRLDRTEAEWLAVAIDECAGAGLIDPRRVSDSLLLRFDRCNASASWREAQETARLRMFGEVRPYQNLYHVYRPGTDWATFAGLMAAESILSGDRNSFDRRADPTRSYTASNMAR